jgi:uncharacterized SAM-binding protein YcdF (DUF218 family)
MTHSRALSVYAARLGDHLWHCTCSIPIDMQMPENTSNDCWKLKSPVENPANEFVGRALRVFAALGAITLLALSVALVLMLGVGHWLVKEDSLQKANAIAVLSGNFPARALEAASLYRGGYAGEIWLTHPGAQSGALAEMGIHYPGEADFNYQVLRRQGVPAKAIRVLDAPIINTSDELEVISTALRQKNSASVIVVTNKAHTRRVHELWNRFDSARGNVIVHGIANDEFHPSAWWTSTEDTHQVIHEILGMINVWAGLPMQSTLRPREAVAQNELQQTPKLVPLAAQKSASNSDD